MDFSAIEEDLIFDVTTNISCVEIPIEDDIIYEDREYFFIFLTSDDPKVSITRPMTNITIIDNDQLTIGFEMENYEAKEDQGSVEVCVRTRGIYQNNKVVRLSTKDIDAEAPNDYANIEVILMFDSTTDRQCVNITIENDMTLENVERFEVLLDRLDDTRVILMPERVEVIITDDDGK